MRQLGRRIALLVATGIIILWIFIAKNLPSSFITDPASRQPLVPPVSPGCEGYWPDVTVCLNLGPSLPFWFKRTIANAGCPQWRINPSSAELEEISRKIRDMEAMAKEWEEGISSQKDKNIETCAGEDIIMKPPVWIRRERGIAWSRIEEGIIAGNSEFHADFSEGDGGHFCWTEALQPIYMKKFGVHPTDRFKDYVAAFDVETFRNRLVQLKRRGT